MAIIDHDLLPWQKTRKKGLRVKVDLYAYATELFEELSRIGIITRIKKIPQLGVIRVPIKLKKSRFDYMVLQLYFHQMIKKKLQNKLKLTYNNQVRASEFRSDMVYLTRNDKPTIGDMLQIITIVYNIGHFYNTFTASRAVIMLSSEDTMFENAILNSSHDVRFQEVARKLIGEHNYHRFHLLNSLLILERCDQSKQSVLLAKELLFAYINMNQLHEVSKLNYIFELFRNVRNVSYVAYDLQIANMPFTIDLWNEDAVIILFEELLSYYNNREPARNLIYSIGKMLDDTVYNESSNAICFYKISRRMVLLMCREYNFSTVDYYNDCFNSENSIFNRRYNQNCDYSKNNILKLTFNKEEGSCSLKLLRALERINNSRIGYYDRHTGERTILVSIKKNSNNKAATAFRILKTSVSFLRANSRISCNDIRFLLLSKFFISYLFSENHVVIKATIDDDICVLCARGKNRRIAELKTLLKQGKGTSDERHEVEFLIRRLLTEANSDTSIIIPGSIQVYQKDAPGNKLGEFDGMVICPMRKSEQILLLEAKNTSSAPNYGRSCLLKTLTKIEFPYRKDNIVVDGRDAYLKVTI